MGSPLFQPRQFSLLDQIIETFLYGKPTGSKLPSEVELAAQLGASRPVIREMLSELRALGAIEILPGKGAFVAADSNLSLTGAALLGRVTPAELHELRTVAEAYNVRKAAEIIDEAAIARLSAIVDVMLATPEPEKWVELDASFHVEIARSTQNMALTNLVQQLRLMLTRQSLRLAALPGRIESADQEHKAIFQAIERRDPDLAEQAIRRHLHKVAEMMSKNWGRVAAARR